MRSVTMVYLHFFLNMCQLLTFSFRALLHPVPLLALLTEDEAERIRHLSSVSSRVLRLPLHPHTQNDIVL